MMVRKLQDWNAELKLNILKLCRFEEIGGFNL